MTSRPIRWIPDAQSARILAAYGRQRQPLRDVLRRALHLLAQADGVLDPRGHIRRQEKP
ncbi:hypothetical protein [Streptomyces sp. NPDC101249]|uniref:hypothetical protein n=1 Tax=Streptomyces sp. NPDC101249 TaxID=3366140 RepID=UPI0038184E35